MTYFDFSKEFPQRLRLPQPCHGDPGVRNTAKQQQPPQETLLKNKAKENKSTERPVPPHPSSPTNLEKPVRQLYLPRSAYKYRKISEYLSFFLGEGNLSSFRVSSRPVSVSLYCIAIKYRYSSHLLSPSHLFLPPSFLDASTSLGLLLQLFFSDQVKEKRTTDPTNVYLFYMWEERKKKLPSPSSRTIIVRQSSVVEKFVIINFYLKKSFARAFKLFVSRKTNRVFCL